MRTWKKFGKGNNIKITKSPPYHIQSNGLVKRGVQTIKTYLNNYNYITIYNTTPSSATGILFKGCIFSYRVKNITSSLNPK